MRSLISNTGVVFDALSERDGQLRELIENANRVFATTASRDRELQETFVALPTFERESRETIDRLTEFARDTDPLVTQLRPAARELSPTLQDLSDLAPELESLFRGLGPLITASAPGFPALERVLEELPPLLGQLDPALRQVNPVLDALGFYKPELTAFLANTVAATQATSVSDEGPAALPAHHEPAQPGEPGRLRHAPADQPAEPVHPAGHVQPAPHRPAVVRDAPVHGRQHPDAGQHADAGPAGAAAAAVDPDDGAAVHARPGRRQRRLLLPAGADRVGRAVRVPGRAGERRDRPAVPAAGPVPAAGRGHAVPAPEGRARRERDRLTPGGMPVADVFERVVRAAARRPRLVLAVLAVLCAGAAVLALGLKPSAATSTLAGRSSDTYQATERYRERFGDHAILVLVRGPLQQLVLTDNLGKLLALEGCLSGNLPEGGTPTGGARSACGALARERPVQVVYGPGTFINSAVGEIQDRLKAQLDAKGAQAERAATAARRLARGQGRPRAEQDRVAKAAEQLVYAQFVRDLLQLNLKYGLGVDKTPRLDDPGFVSTLVFDPSRGATTPKARFAYLFPSPSSAMIQVRLKPGLSDAERERATALVRDAVRMPAFALHDADGYTVTGVPVLAQDVTDALTGSLVRLLLIAVLVMAVVLALVFRRRLRLVPLVVALAAVTLTFGLMALAGAPLTMASVAVLPVLLGLAVDYAIQYQSRIADPPGPATAARAARRAVPVIATAALATAAGFLVLLLSPVPMVRGFGVLLVRRGRGGVRGGADRRDGGARVARRPPPAGRSRARRAGAGELLGGAARPLARAGGGGRAARRRDAPRRAGAARSGARRRPRARRGRLGRRHADRGALGPAAARPAGPAGGPRPRHAAARDRRGRRGRRAGRGQGPGRPEGHRVDGRLPGSGC